MSSSTESKRIAELETTMADMVLRVKQLEAIVAEQRHASTPTPTRPLTPSPSPARRVPGNPSSGRPSSGRYTTRQKPTTPSQAKPMSKETPPKPKDDSILYNVNVPKTNGAEVVHLKFIQTLHASGVPKEEICQRTMDEFPDLCTGGSDKARHARVWNEVKMNTSRWAVKDI